MRMLRLTLAAVLVAFVGACGLDDTSPTDPLALPPASQQITGLALDAQAPAAPVHLVLLRPGARMDLEGAVGALGGEVSYLHPATGFAVVRGLSPESAMELRATKGIDRVDGDAVVELDPMVPATEMVPGPASPSDPTTAYFYSRQWNMRAIGADDAWAAGRLGSSDVTVAILDTGIDYLYPDLDGRVDLSRSVSFIPEEAPYLATYFPTRHPITDLDFHGTHVAATVASNAYVAAGVTSQTTLMGVKVCSPVLGGCPWSAIFSGILYAVDQGADVANLSLGGTFTKAGNGQFVGYLNRLFNFANSRGMTVVVSAGNDAADLDHNGNAYKTFCDTPNTVCVAATGPASADDIRLGPWYDVDAPAVYTNYGRSAINVAAPGGNTGGWVWAACSQTSLTIGVCRTGTYIVGATGTSMAAPHVTGLAALLVEDHGRNPGRIKTGIQNSADDLGARGVDPYYGKGRINVAKAVGAN